jgi:hypothetical protein
MISVSELFFSHVSCPNCKSVIGVQWTASGAFSLVIFVATLVSSLMVFLQMGFYAAILWFPFPIGSLNYLKVRLCPLEAKKAEARSPGRSAT